MARLTLNGFLNYDNTLFDNVVLPEGINKDFVINEIMKRGDLYPYHQALGPLKFNIECWFSRRFFDFQMLFDALRAEYSPIENYDRKESISRTHEKNGEDVTTGNNTANTTANLNRNESLSDNTSNLESVSAYNAVDFQNANKADMVKEARTNSEDRTSSNASSNSTASTKYGSGYVEGEENRIHGNIGVTTNAQMIAGEIELRSKFDLYAVIASQFEKEFLIQVY